MKLQYQKNFNSTSYLRLFGYTNYSNWFISGPVSEFFNYGGQIGDFEITEHAYGAKAIYENQLSSKHLLSANLLVPETSQPDLQQQHRRHHLDQPGRRARATATTSRPATTRAALRPSTFRRRAAAVAVAAAAVRAAARRSSTRRAASTSTPSSARRCPASRATPKLVPGNPPPGSLAAVNGARWLVTENGAWTDQYDNVAPIWSAVALTDQWHPNDRLTVNAGLRAERYDYDLGNAISGFPARAFWFSAFNRENCYAQGQPSTTAADDRSDDRAALGLSRRLAPDEPRRTRIPAVRATTRSCRGWASRICFARQRPARLLRPLRRRAVELGRTDQRLPAESRVEPGRVSAGGFQHAVPQRAARARE